MTNKMIIRKISIVILSLVILLSFVSGVYAIALTGEIGNSRMILRAETGDKLEKYVLVKNPNEVDVNIKIFATGDLKDDIILKDTEFTLAPGSEKKAYFTINVKKEGVTESKINVAFNSNEDKNGVGLSSTVIVVAGGEDIVDDDTAGSTSDEDETGNNAGITGDVVDDNKSKLGLGMILGVITVVMILVLALVAFMFVFRKKKEFETKPEKRVNKR